MKKLKIIGMSIFLALAVFSGCFNSSGDNNSAEEFFTLEEDASGNYYILGGDILLDKQDDIQKLVIDYILALRESGQKTKRGLTDAPAIFSKWPNGIVKYCLVGFDNNNSGKQDLPKDLDLAMRTWESAANVSFIDNGSCGDYIYKIIKASKASGISNSTTGRVKNAVYNCSSLDYKVILHELGHGLGLQHEHQRPDRDKYISVSIENGTATYSDWKKLPTEIHYRPCDYFNDSDIKEFCNDQQTQIYGAYDYYSIMHYSMVKTIKNTIGTITTIDPFYQEKIGIFPHLSPTDQFTIRAIYGAPNAPDIEIYANDTNKIISKTIPRAIENTDVSYGKVVIPSISTYNFGEKTFSHDTSVDYDHTATFTIANKGSQNLEIYKVKIENNSCLGAIMNLSQPVKTVLAQNEITTFSVRFQTNQPVKCSGQIVVSNNDSTIHYPDYYYKENNYIINFTANIQQTAVPKPQMVVYNNDTVIMSQQYKKFSVSIDGIGPDTAQSELLEISSPAAKELSLTIINKGDAPLSIGTIDLIDCAAFDFGYDCLSAFSVVKQPESVINPQQSTSFVIRLEGYQPGLFMTTINITNNFNGTYTFTLKEQIDDFTVEVMPLTAGALSETTSLDVNVPSGVITNITKVELYRSSENNQILLGEATLLSIPLPGATTTGEHYIFEWNTTSVADGSYQIIGKVYTSYGSVYTANCTVTVMNTITTTAISVITPDKQYLSATELLAVVVPWDFNANVNRVELYKSQNGTTTLLGIAQIYNIPLPNANPNGEIYALEWDTTTTPNGSYQISAKVYLNSGVIYNSQNPATVNVNNFSCSHWYAQNSTHVALGRAYTDDVFGVTIYKTIGTTDILGSNASDYTWVKETSPGYFEAGQCN